MSNNILIATVGLPRSGKTTWASEYSKKHSIPMVNPDSVRLALHGQRFASSAEMFVWATVHVMIRALFLAGHSQVILDATNVSRKRRDALLGGDWTTYFHVIDTAADTCRKRALAVNDMEILSVIDRMQNEWVDLQDNELVFVPISKN